MEAQNPPQNSICFSKNQRGMHSLKGRIQHYTWGGNTFIPLLFHQTHDEHPCAEYWLGIHPGAPSQVLLGQGASTSLQALINSDKVRYLGKSVNEQFGNLPYLLKILDVKDMLSIQVHPNKQAAEEGFKKENELAIPLTAPNRNYKDDNHKPEMMVALSDFWLLHGFSSNIEQHLDTYGFLNGFKDIFQKEGIKGLYQKVMELPQEEVDRLIAPHVQAIMPLYEANQLPKSSPDFWAARAVLGFCGDGHFDRGIFSIYLFNILNLKPGEGIFQGAGLPHAYLEGQNIELMSNSDNVLRAGLTPKHVDIPELLANTAFVPTIAKIIPGSLNKPEQQYPCPIADFSLNAYFLKAGEKMEFDVASPSIFLMLNGEVHWKGNASADFQGAAAFFSAPGEKLFAEAKADTNLFLASVPLQ
jgi:mannose-6-phosphate isomerase